MNWDRFFFDILFAGGLLVLILIFWVLNGHYRHDPCDPVLLDFRKPGLYRCLVQENGVRAWIRVEEEY